ncbi:hypothetical protein PR003_g11799 [Phytophthora rubi]|uniref:Uncharacterized protein n=1 Tax=Phytophthora rubi TaxID=129364 RepID=A0A6A4F718_9STRA|nr:hypothetical protein PR002_g11499 [Phytophthora rubi]KAE9029957.1 hypothetical protein PR001_g11371 [Phytophthora rubi]KAE9337854.1 hypothetical protein PR003_g11799 [Phytophthora rubi]
MPTPDSNQNNLWPTPARTALALAAFFLSSSLLVAEWGRAKDPMSLIRGVTTCFTGPLWV